MFCQLQLYEKKTDNKANKAYEKSVVCLIEIYK